MEKVVVLMSTFNGEKFLQEQLDSLYAQKDVEVEIVVRDDGSTDKTQEILEKNSVNRKLSWYSGKNLKPALSFMDLVKDAPECKYYAFCDQDDIWFPEKLSKAVNVLSKLQEPSVYYCNSILIDSQKRIIGKSVFKKVSDKFAGLSYGNAALGCTMVFNSSLMRILKERIPKQIIMHDAWVTNVCQIVHGKILCTEDAYMYYRQHDKNEIGGKNDLLSTMKRKFKFALNNKNLYKQHWCSLYRCLSNYFDEDSKEIIEVLVHYDDSLINRLKIIINRKILWKNDIKRNAYYIFMFLSGLF